MLKRLFELIAIVCLIVFVPYLAFLLVDTIYPDFIFIPHGDDDYGVFVLRWLLCILAIGVVSAAVLIVGMTYTYIRYGMKDDSNEGQIVNINLFNSYDTSNAVKAFFGALRLICTF